MQKITLKAARINAKLTQKQAAKAIGVDQGTLLRWEKNPGLVKLAYLPIIEEVYKFPTCNIFFIDNCN